MKKTILWLGAALLAAQVAHGTVTDKQGQNYVNECLAAGVPTPPDWPSSRWTFSGTLDKPLDPHNASAPMTFISRDRVAEVYYFDSRTVPGQPVGICIGLPRFIPPVTGGPTDTITLFGIICQGKNGNACFWDNKNNGANFMFQRGATIPIVGPPGVSFEGGTDLAKSSEKCTSCHAGENAFIIHPENREPDRSALALDPFLLRADSWYNPIVPDGWPQNPGPGNQLDNVASAGSCIGCHRLPQLSRELAGFCGDELENAIRYTMPAFQPQNLIFRPAFDPRTNLYDPAYEAHVRTLQDACKTPAPAEMLMIMD